MKIEQIRIKNFKALRDITLRDLPNLAVFLGANGTGKTTLFDVFSFLQDCLLHNVRAAVAKRGGFRELRTRDETGDIEFGLKFRTDRSSPLITYELHIRDQKGAVEISRERLQYRRGQYGQPWRFLDFAFGQGTAITNEADYETEGAEDQREEQKLQSPDILALKGLGQFERFRAAAAFRELIERWHVSDLRIHGARAPLEAGYAEHLNTSGENLALVTQYLFQNHQDRFQKILDRMKERVPGITNVQATQTEDGRIVLRFSDG
ncbi:MAG: AAA family ATPase, partial [Fimbriimonadaceae bacterium]|nr:AAA family ATPase [Fimbriimonadaceae bacterium]